MPAKAPPANALVTADLVAMGQHIRTKRVAQKVTAIAAAEAAGMSRVTLHRIERGEPSVTMGAYLNAMAAVGLEWTLHDLNARGPQDTVARPPARVRLADYPQLKRLAWQQRGIVDLSAADALSLYERNWRHIDSAAMTPNERALVQSLAVTLGGGRLLV